MAKPGRRPKPTAVKELTGRFQKDPQRRPTNEPVAPEGVPECPERFDDVARAEWFRVCGILQQMKILSPADCAALEVYCHSFARWVEACQHIAEEGAVLVQKKRQGYVEKGGKRVPDYITESRRNPWDMIREKNAATVLKILTEFGLTPSSRSRVNAGLGQGAPAPPTDSFTNLMNRRKAQRGRGEAG